MPAPVRLLATAALSLLVSAGGAAAQKHLAPIPAKTVELMEGKGTGPSAPILMRSFKKEAELEVWKLGPGGRYVHLKTFPICRWSGQLGPKTRTGDRQTPEGFYAVAPGQMNPNSAYHLSFNLGYPNAYDRAHGGTGSHLMVHGTCSSMGCFAMTDAQVSEIYALAREAFAGGQRAFQYQSFPFRMTAANMARHRTDPHIGFWRQLKEGFDRFEATGEEPAVGVEGGRYVFAPSRNAAREALAQERRKSEEAKLAALLEEGVAAVRTTYSDGGMHSSFAALWKTGGARLGEVSRPEALALAGREVVVIAARAKPPLPPVLLAGIRPDPAPAGPGRAEPSPFASASLGLWSGHPAAAGALIAGAAPILPAALASARPVQLAAR